ncbi:MAG: hypothetical protein HY908_05230 [Myxococcales bacterium]|nr:hypothetical protein [Myxococcales bacterium]
MRITTFAWFLGLGTATLVAAACSNEVSSTSGTGGAGNTTTTTTTSTTSTSTTTTTTTTTTSTTTTSTTGDVCQQACQHIVDCMGFDVCAQIGGIDCSTVQNQCLADCVNATACADMGIGTLQTCQQGCQGTGGNGAGGAGGASAQSCGQCGQGNCGTEIQACLGISGCGSFNPNDPTWFGCITGCLQNDFTSTCFGACDQQYANASAGYGPIYTCMCGSCATECAPVDPCNH